ncbi:hypothetical protein RF11_05992 [Thelohanellus kitauei]|uniref:Uncharacterized protein n=1 Tax=Thelohanellus kitauei TaxID=669202 RepID=A0A0C2IN29_THEKT|nr:hypothetical protein RF11_05992 [Thelohanellus kitauei]
MDVEDRQAVEQLFLSQQIRVNLPAHLVIIKSTFQYVNGKIEEYSSTQINQMIGRAGRPQFHLALKTFEFNDVLLRTGEKKLLNDMAKNETIRLMQATMGCIGVHDFSLLQDITVCSLSEARKSSSRRKEWSNVLNNFILVLVDFCAHQKYHQSSKAAVDFSKCIRAKSVFLSHRLWENTPYVSRQIEKIGFSTFITRSCSFAADGPSKIDHKWSVFDSVTINPFIRNVPTTFKLKGAPFSETSSPNCSPIVAS